MFHVNYMVGLFKQFFNRIKGWFIVPGIEKTKQKNADAIEEAISTLGVKNYDAVSTLLPKLLAKGALALDESAYTPLNPETTESSGIGRDILSMITLMQAILFRYGYLRLRLDKKQVSMITNIGEQSLFFQMRSLKNIINPLQIIRPDASLARTDTDSIAIKMN